MDELSPDSFVPSFALSQSLLLALSSVGKVAERFSSDSFKGFP